GVAYSVVLAAAFEKLRRRAVMPSEMMAMRVGDVVLSERLYRHAAATASEGTAIVRQHAQGVHQAREVLLARYDGYSQADGVRRPLEGAARAELPAALRQLTREPRARRTLGALLAKAQRQAARVKSPALRAAYLEALQAWEAGAARE